MKINNILYLRNRGRWAGYGRHWFVWWLLLACGKLPSSSLIGCCTEIRHLQSAIKDTNNFYVVKSIAAFHLLQQLELRYENDIKPQLSHVLSDQASNTSWSMIFQHYEHSNYGNMFTNSNWMVLYMCDRFSELELLLLLCWFGIQKFQLLNTNRKHGDIKKW